MSEFARTDDPDTSWAAAAKAARASGKAVAAVLALMHDGVARTDQEIRAACRPEYVVSLSTIQHGRLALSESDILLDTGERRPTEDGMLSRVWVKAVK